MLTIRRIAPWCFALALIIYLRPYTGIRHDATLYLAQALNVLSPDIFGRDLFFLAGSQADFTIFPQLLAFLIQRFDAGQVFLVLTLVSRLAFYGATAYAIWGIFPEKLRWPALLAVIVMPGGYGSYSMFAYAEQFLTSRPFAEALSLCALGLIVRGRSFSAIALFAAAATLHPLQALAASLVGWCWLVSEDRRWAWAITALVPMIGLALLKMGPFSGLIIAIDAEWRELIDVYSDKIFVSRWEPRDWCIVVTDVYILFLLGARSGGFPLLARFSNVALAALAAGLTLSALLSDILQLRLPAGLQFWRVTWIVHWAAMAAAPFVIWTEWRMRERRDWCAVLLLIAIVGLGASVSRLTLPWAILGLIPLHMFWPMISPKIGRTVRVIFLFGLVGVLIAGMARYQLSSWFVFKALGWDLHRARQDVVVVAFPLIIAAITLGVAVLYRRSGAVGGAMLGLCSMIALIASLWVWDSRSPWSRVVETAGDSNVFSYDIPAEASVYWYTTEPSPLGPWMVLGRANYFNVFQMAGQVFNRGTSFAGIQRQIQVTPVNSQAQICDAVNASTADPDSCWIGDQGLQYLCTPYEDIPSPDYFILPFKQKRGILGEWVPRDLNTGAALGKFYLYRCSDWKDPTGAATLDRESLDGVSFKQRQEDL